MPAPDPVPTHAPGPRLVVFDFDHTLFRGDSGAMLVRWLIFRHWQRRVLAALATPLLAPLLLWAESRRVALSAYLWIATIGWRRRDFVQHVDRFVRGCGATLEHRLMAAGITRLHAHRESGDRVVIATGAPPELVGRILAFVAHEDVPVVGTRVGRRLRAVIATHHCHAREKLRMLERAGYAAPFDCAYSDSIADLPLLAAAREPVAVNPRPRALRAFRAACGERLRVEHW